MRMIPAPLLLLIALTAVPGAAQPVPEMPPAPLKSPTDAELDALVTEATRRNPQAGPVVKLVDLGPVAVPAITQGLWADTTTRRGCIALLGMIGADARDAAPSLTRFLAADNPEVRAEAARALGLLGAHRAVLALTKLTEDESPVVRLAACEALIRLGASADVVLPALTKSLKAEQPEEARAAARLFADLGPEAAPALPTLNNQIAGADPILTALIAEVLGRIGPDAKDALPALKTKLSEDKNPALYRVPSALALWHISRDPDAARVLREALDKKSPTAPHHSLWRIDQSKETGAALEKQLKAEGFDDVRVAAQVLGTRSKETVPALARFLKSDNLATRVGAAMLLSEFGPEGRDGLETLQKFVAERPTVGALTAIYRIAPSPKIARALTDLLEDKHLGLEAAAALAELRPTNQAVVLELIAALDSPDENVKLTAAVALWRIEKNAQALPAVTKRLRSNDPKVRELAAVDLGGEFGPGAKDAVPELAKRLFDPFASVRSASAEALGRIGPGNRDAVQPLLAVLDGAEPAFVHSAACEALGLIRPDDKGESVAALKKKLKHSDALVRTHAALALLRVAGDKSGEKEADAGLTWRTHHVRITAAEAMWLISKDARAIPLLIRALEESNLEGTGSDNERYMAARALGRIGADAKDAVPELVKLVAHRDHALRSIAVTALKAVDPAAATKAGVK